MIPSSRRLVLVRHGQSQANADGLFTGRLNPPLTEDGRREACTVGTILRDEGHRFNAAFTSTMTRAVTTMALTLDALGQAELVPRRDAALDERDYGDLGGLDKATAHRRFGAGRVEDWRRSYEGRPPNGESLKNTVARVVPFHLRHIQPAAMRAPTLVVGHGNALRPWCWRSKALGRTTSSASNSRPDRYGSTSSRRTQPSRREGPSDEVPRCLTRLHRQGSRTPASYRTSP